jgi:hypothetical protein
MGKVRGMGFVWDKGVALGTNAEGGLKELIAVLQLSNSANRSCYGQQANRG